MRFSRTVEVKQSPRSVWASLEDFDRWSKWATPLGTPRRISPGPWQLGWRARLGNTVYEITDLTPGKMMIWFGSSFGTTSVWTILVEPVRGRTEATVIVETSGWLPTLFGRWTGKGFDKRLRDALEGFRQQAEASPVMPRVTQD
jgi:hypothetical protein